MELFNIVLLFGFLCLTELEAAERCEQIDNCSCQFSNGTKVDITSLGNKDNTPRFKDVLGPKGEAYYSYNPCVGFTEGHCSDAAVCMLNQDKTASVQIGDSSRVGFQYDVDSGDTIVVYTAGIRRDLKLSLVLLVCDPKAIVPSIVANGQQATGAFLMTLNTVCACADGCSSSGPNYSARKGPDQRSRKCWF